MLQDPNLLTIDFKKYLLAEYMLQKATNKDDLIVLAFKVNNILFDYNGIRPRHGLNDFIEFYTRNIQLRAKKNYKIIPT